LEEKASGWGMGEKGTNYPLTREKKTKKKTLAEHWPGAGAQKGQAQFPMQRCAGQQSKSKQTGP